MYRLYSFEGQPVSIDNAFNIQENINWDNRIVFRHVFTFLEYKEFFKRNGNCNCFMF